MKGTGGEGFLYPSLFVTGGSASVRGKSGTRESGQKNQETRPRRFRATTESNYDRIAGSTRDSRLLTGKIITRYGTTVRSWGWDFWVFGKKIGRSEV